MSFRLGRCEYGFQWGWVSLFKWLCFAIASYVVFVVTSNI